MTSQRWLTDADFSAGSESGSIWWHYLVVIVPDEIKYTRNASIWITGGSQGMGAPKAGDEDVVFTAALATSLGIVSGVLSRITFNEHTTFSADPIQKSRTEGKLEEYVTIFRALFCRPAYRCHHCVHLGPLLE